MDWPNCIRCGCSRVVLGGIPGEGHESVFRVDSSIASRRSWLAGVNHEVTLDGLAWLCLDCGLVWQEVNKLSFETFQATLHEKCGPEYKQRLFESDAAEKE